MFTNPCESAQKFRNFLLLNLFCYTYRLFKAPRSLCSKIEKARTRKYCPLFTQQDSHSISFVVFSLALFVCFPGLKGYPPNRWPTMGESTFHAFPYITWRTALQTKRRWAPPSNKRCIHCTLTTGSRTVAPEIKHWKHELVLLRWTDVGQFPFCLLGRGNDSQESSSKNSESL